MSQNLVGISDKAWKSPWPLLFVALSVGISFVVLILVVFPLSVSLFGGPSWVANWGVFAANAAVSGIIADQILRRRFRVVVLAGSYPRLPMIWVWLAFMLLIGVLGPTRVGDLVHALKMRFFEA